MSSRPCWSTSGEPISKSNQNTNTKRKPTTAKNKIKITNPKVISQLVNLRWDWTLGVTYISWVPRDVSVCSVTTIIWKSMLPNTSIRKWYPKTQHIHEASNTWDSYHTVSTWVQLNPRSHTSYLDTSAFFSCLSKVLLTLSMWYLPILWLYHLRREIIKPTQQTGGSVN